MLCGIKLDFSDGVHTPLKGLKRVTALIIPDLDHLACSREHVLGVTVVKVGKHVLTGIASFGEVIFEVGVVDVGLVLLLNFI